MDSSSDLKQSKATNTIERRSQQNALVLFVLFLLQPIALVIFFAVRMAGSTAFSEIYFWIRDFGVLGGLYALFFLPVRWRVILQMLKFHRVTAIVGSAGLILFLLIELPGIWRAL